MGHGSEKPAPLATRRPQRLIPDNHLAEWDAAIEGRRQAPKDAGGMA